jgi:hypothetical protein
MIFTSPSSALGDLDEEVDPALQKKRKDSSSKRPPVATQIGMDGQVTARAIAYAAVQVWPSFAHLPTSLRHHPSFTSPSTMQHNG